MATKTKNSRTKKQTEKPVNAAIRAPEPWDPDPVTIAPEQLASHVAQKAMLASALEIVDFAEGSFEVEGEYASPDPAAVLREACRAARQDFDQFAMSNDASDHEASASAMRRAESRLHLALLIHEFRRKYGGTALAGIQRANLREQGVEA